MKLPSRLVQADPIGAQKAFLSSPRLRTVKQVCVGVVIFVSFGSEAAHCGLACAPRGAALRPGFTRMGNGTFAAKRSRGMATRQGKILVEPGARGPRLRPGCEAFLGGHLKETDDSSHPCWPIAVVRLEKLWSFRVAEADPNGRSDFDCRGVASWVVSPVLTFVSLSSAMAASCSGSLWPPCSPVRGITSRDTGRALPPFNPVSLRETNPPAALVSR